MSSIALNFDDCPFTEIEELRLVSDIAITPILCVGEDDKDVCSVCGKEIKEEEGILICLQCNKKDDVTTSNYSYYACNSYTSIICTGNGGKEYTKKLLKCTVDKVNNLEKKASDELNTNNRNAIYKISSSAIGLAVDYYLKVKEMIKSRSEKVKGKSGILSACLWYACNHMNIYKSYDEIIQFMKKKPKLFYEGLEIIRKYLQIDVNNVTIKLEQYMRELNIDIEYKDFLIKVINVLDKYKTKDYYDKTICAGLIYFLVETTKLDVSCERISDVCGVLKNTFIEYYNIMLRNGIHLKPLFKLNKMKMPSAWRNL